MAKKKTNLDYVIDKPVTVAELIKKLQSLPKEFKNANVYVGFEENNGEGEQRVLNSIELSEEDGEIYLVSSDYE